MQIRCPHCQNAIELVDDSDFQSIDCPSCGSQFGLVDVEQTEIDTLSKSRGATATIGHFELIEEVGRGAFGTVWRARDAELDREVAIKIPRAHRLSDEDREQFLREARAVAQRPKGWGKGEVGEGVVCIGPTRASEWLAGGSTAAGGNSKTRKGFTQKGEGSTKARMRLF